MPPRAGSGRGRPAASPRSPATASATRRMAARPAAPVRRRSRQRAAEDEAKPRHPAGPPPRSGPRRARGPAAQGPGQVGAPAGDQERDPAGLRLAKQRDDLARRRLVEPGGRLVGEQEPRRPHQGPGQAEPAMLGGGQLGRPGGGPRREAGLPQRRQRQQARRAPRGAARARDEGDVVQRGAVGEEPGLRRAGGRAGGGAGPDLAGPGSPRRRRPPGAGPGSGAPRRRRGGGAWTSRRPAVRSRRRPRRPRPGREQIGERGHGRSAGPADVELGDCPELHHAARAASNYREGTAGAAEDFDTGGEATGQAGGVSRSTSRRLTTWGLAFPGWPS